MARPYKKNPPKLNFGPITAAFEVQVRRIAAEWLHLNAPEDVRDSFTGFSAAKFNGFVLVMQFDTGKPIGVLAVHKDSVDPLVETITRAAAGPDFGVSASTADEAGDDVSAG